MAKNNQINPGVERQDDPELEQGDDLEFEQQADPGVERQTDQAKPKPKQREYRHEVLEDCILNGIYRNKGEIVFSEGKKLPHCSVIA
ncbi:MAG: hypothetical protein LBT87_00995 [Treponema sp.]|jgi:hypothetical protein|nr:hypothetical protein [Treponema sp.]